MWDKIFGVVDRAIKPVTNLVDDVHTSKEEKQQLNNELEEIKNRLTSEMISVQKEELKAKTEILTTDAKSGNWLLESWRPLTILSLVGIYVLILANNYIVAPALAKYTDIASVQFTMPPDLGSIIKLILGTFTFGKSAEIVAGRVSGSHDSNRREIMK
jgi:hypothetical protein